MALAYIGLGANLPSATGSPKETLFAASRRISALGREIARSSLYSTEPVGYADQPRFVNAVIGIETGLGPRDLLSALLGIERDFGRDRSHAIANGPRSLDLDILLHGDLIVSEAGLEIPHPRLSERAFVLVPLNEVAPNIRDPRSGVTMQELLQQLQAVLSRQWDQSANEVVAIESDGWNAGVVRTDVGDSGARAGAGSPGNHG
jgi:2-amino-4-hydroxy-6-hydroxymethyldihydropteridine diphosphokinase